MLENGRLAVLGVAGFHQPRAVFVRLQLVAPDRLVDVTVNASFFSGMTSVDRARRRPEQAIAPVDVDRPRALAHGPSAFIMRHCGLHCGIRLRSDTNVPHLGHRLVDVDLCLQQRRCHWSPPRSKSAEPALRPARPAAHSTELPQHDRRAEHADPRPANGERPPRLQGGHRERHATAMSQPAVITTITGHGLSKPAGRAGGSGATLPT
jgi:hypothetical protein